MEEYAVLLFFPACFAVGLAMRVVLRFVYGARGAADGDTAWAIVVGMSWALIAIGMAPVVLLLIVSRLGLILLLIVGITALELVIARRDTQRRTNAALLGLLAEKSKSLDAAAIFTNEQARRLLGREGRSLFRALAEGAPLRQAVRAYPRALPARRRRTPRSGTWQTIPLRPCANWGRRCTAR
jgi:hypothetical protein